MALVLTAAAGVEPISLAQAKAQLRVDTSDEDALIGSLIATARSYVERTLGLALITQGWSYYLDHWPRSGVIALPIRPVQTVTAVKVHDASGGVTTLDESAYAVDALSQPGRLSVMAAMPPVAARQLNAFEIDFTAGYGDEAENVPEPIRQALLLLVAHWFERREPVAFNEGPQEIPMSVAALLAPYRRYAL
jgi:uncharacterized phiE125 gp8 family phage protein